MPEHASGSVIAGKYRIAGVLGSGAMGVVYRAEQLDAEDRVLREVALKTMQPSLSSDASFAKRFLREVRIAARLASPHVVTIYDAGRGDDGTLYFTMELVRGRTLRELLDQEPRLPVGRAVGIAAQICDALAEAHGAAEPVVHRDLKPANAFVEERRGEDRVKVTDFGIAKVIGEETSALTGSGTSPGTPRYMAPEQWRGEPVDGRADLYALGVILYECLTGATPFSGALETVMYKHLNEPPAPLPASLPAPLRELVAKLLAKRPDDRPRDALEVQRVLGAIAEESAPNAEPEAAANLPGQPPPAPLGPRPGASLGKLSAYGLGAILVAVALVAIARWLAAPSPTVIVERSTRPTPRPTASSEALPSRMPEPRPSAPVPSPAAPTAAPVAPAVLPPAAVGAVTKVASPAVEDAKDCDRAPLSAAEVKNWLDAYRRALVAKDVATLHTLGAVGSSEEAQALKRRLEPLRDFQVEIEDVAIRTEGARAELSFSVAERWRDAHQPSTVYDFNAEKRLLGRRECVVVALP